MKIERISGKPPGTIEMFAVDNDLTMVIRHPITGSSTGYEASFKGAEIAKDGFLFSQAGYGATEEEAIDSYAALISGKVLRLSQSKRINVPNLARIERVKPATW